MPTLVQALPAPMDKACNLATIDKYAATAAILGSEFIVFPELFLTGYNMGDALRALAEPLDGPSINAISAMASRHGVGIVIGLPERRGHAVYNSVIALDADGRIAGVYRKIHLFGDVEPTIFARGDQVGLAQLGKRRVGLAICYDIEFPEVGRALARDGADIICVPTANMEPYLEVPTTLVRARALENSVPIIYANLVGQEGHLTYTGLSAIVGADGRDVARAGATAEAILHVSAADLFSSRGDLFSTQRRDLRL